MAFAGRYEKNDPTYLKTAEYEEPKELFKQTASLISSEVADRPVSIVDVGCASGAFLHYLRTVVTLTRTVGTDISNEHLSQARKHVPGVEFLLDSIEAPRATSGMTFDLCTCLGTVAIFDDLESIVTNLLALVAPGGSLFVADLVNDEPVDVLARYRRAEPAEPGDWNRAFNMRSKLTYERMLAKLSPGVSVKWTDFRLPFGLPKSSDPLRAWTIQTESNPHQLVVGTGQLLNIKILQARKQFAR